ncbi:hypothetical protein [Burkholderia ambifaria]|uniref:hypothetical protein n=1 Tax=Burkholderia ambifaria TaxID=152480 RepID=UPI001589387E|nr:hypothetical protein [Burkholderia ambifaria]
MRREAVLAGGGAESGGVFCRCRRRLAPGDHAADAGSGVAFIQLMDRDARACRYSPENIPTGAAGFMNKLININYKNISDYCLNSGNYLI